MRAEFVPFAFPERSGGMAVTHAAVVPMDSNRILHNHTVIMENGRIKAIAPSGDIDPSAYGAERCIDGRGLYLMPGLADMYTHYREPAEAPLYLAHGITTARTSGNLFQLGMERAAARGEFPSPRVITVTPGFDGLGPSGRTDMPSGVPVTRPEEAAALVAAYADRGYHHIMPFSLLAPDVLRAISKAAEARGLRVVGNCPNAQSWEQAVDCGMSGFQQLHIVARGHMRDADEAVQDYWDRFDPAPGTKLDFEKIRRLGAFLAKHQVWNLPTVVFHQRASQPAEISLAHPSLRYVPRSTINDWETTIVRWGRRGRVEADVWRALARERAKAFHTIVRIFHEEGAPQLTCTDGVNPYNVQGDTLIQEIGNFKSAGMSPFEALSCSTREAARFMNETDEWGTIAIGKRADVILLRQNPLEDVSALRSIETVFINGYYLDRACLDSLLREREALAQKGPPVVATPLPIAASDSGLVEEGVWRERICDQDFGRVAFRHTQLADEGWLIEEVRASAEPRRHMERRASRIRLDKALNVLSADYDVETAVGVEHGKVMADTKGYVLQYETIDGQTLHSRLDGPRMPPSDVMALSVPPRLASTAGAGTVSALDAGTALGRTELTFTREKGLSKAWSIEVARPGYRATQKWNLDADGRLHRMDETTILLWPRELVAISPPSRMN